MQHQDKLASVLLYIIYDRFSCLKIHTPHKMTVCLVVSDRIIETSSPRDKQLEDAAAVRDRTSVHFNSIYSKGETHSLSTAGTSPLLLLIHSSVELKTTPVTLIICPPPITYTQTQTHTDLLPAVGGEEMTRTFLREVFNILWAYIHKSNQRNSKVFTCFYGISKYVS